MNAIPLEPALGLRRGATARSVDRYFAFACVDGSDEIAECYRLRYEVYCLERGFLPAGDYPNHLESDVYDTQALHFLARHRHGEPAGTARLVLNGPLGLPMVPHCTLGKDYGFLADPRGSLGSGYAEISRLAVSKGFRRRREDTVYGGPPRTSPREPGPPCDGSSAPPPGDLPEMISGLFRLIYQESKRRGITHWVAAMERSLQVMLKRMGIAFSPIGPEVDYYGPVRAYVADIAAVERYVSQQRPETRDYMVAGLEPHLIPRVDGDSRQGTGAQSRVAVAPKTRVA